MTAAGKDIAWRAGGQVGVGEQRYQQGWGGLHHSSHGFHAGMENVLVDHFILDAIYEYDSGDPANRGSSQFLLGARIEARLNILHFDKLDQHGLDLLPEGVVGVGKGLYHAETGLDPESGSALTVRLGAYLVYSHVAGPEDWMSFDIGPGFRCGESFTQGFEDCYASAQVTLFSERRECAAEPDSCYPELVYEKNQLTRQLYAPTEQRENLVSRVHVNAATLDFVRKLVAQELKIHEEVQTYCPKAPPKLEIDAKDYQPITEAEVPPLPKSDFVKLSCEDELELVRETQEEVRKLSEISSEEQGPLEPKKTYPGVDKVLQQQEAEIKKALETLLNWPPLECSPIPNPPRFILFPNDNPNISLDWQNRAELGNATPVYSNPILDEVILYLKRNHEDNKNNGNEDKNLQIRLIAIANETSSDANHDKDLANWRLRSVVDYLTVRGINCASDAYGTVCEYAPSGAAKNSEENGQHTKKIGGAYSSPEEGSMLRSGKLTREKLSERDVCSVSKDGAEQIGEAYTAKELFINGKLRPEVQRLFPQTLWSADSRSPIFRSVLIEFVPKGTCPKPLLGAQ